MAHIVEEGAEGAETGIAKKAVTINEWLETNRLGKLKVMDTLQITLRCSLLFKTSYRPIPFTLIRATLKLKKLPWKIFSCSPSLKSS